MPSMLSKSYINLGHSGAVPLDRGRRPRRADFWPDQGVRRGRGRPPHFDEGVRPTPHFDEGVRPTPHFGEGVRPTHHFDQWDRPTPGYCRLPPNLLEKP
jgi:hypothetical protein